MGFNLLTWFLYLAGVVNNFGPLFIIIGIFFFLWAIFKSKDGRFDVGSYSPCQSLLTGNSNKQLGFAVMFFILAAMIPSKETLYLMAGSEYGEVVVTDERVQETFTKIGEVINQKLDNIVSENVDNGSDRPYK